MAVCGWCISGKHKECPKQVQKFYHGHTGSGRNKKPAIIYLDEYNICECKHHKPKTTRKKKK